ASSAATHVGSEEDSDSKWAKIKAWLNSDRTKTGRTLVHKIGVVAVPLSYLTVGLQTAVLAAAGLVRIQWWKFTVAQIPGAIAWATIYSGVGDRKSTRLNSSHVSRSYAVFCLKKKNTGMWSRFEQSA